MKILWVVNIPCMGLGELAGLPINKSGGGGWLTAAIKSFEGKNDVEIAVVTTYPTKEIKKMQISKNVNSLKLEFHRLP